MSSAWVVTGWALVVAAMDAVLRRIPNSLTLGAAAVALLVLAVTGQTVLGADWRAGLYGGVAALLLTLPGYAKRWLGAADVKLLLAIGLLGGWRLMLASFAVAGLLSGLVAVVWVGLGRRAATADGVPKRWLPFGAALAIGLLAACWSDLDL